MDTAAAATNEPPRRLARLKVDAAAIAENWRSFRKAAPASVCAAVVKADGYGLGAETAAKALAKAGARSFFTATLGEALQVRRLLGQGPAIYVLNGPTETDAPLFGPAGLIPVLNSLAQMSCWDRRGPAALHIDTGMNRLGLGPEELAAAAAALKGASLALVMSHLACGGAPSHEMNARQRAKFLDAAQAFPVAPLSLAATAGALIGPDFQFDMIRPGIGLYGASGLDEGGPSLQAAALVEAPILQIRDVAPGDTLGYGGGFIAAQKMRTATVAIGYADGFLRSLSGRGYGVLAGQHCPLLGRVSMDLVILDVTGCAEARPGAMVEFLGPNAPLDDIAARAGTLAYEILTTLAGTVRRMGGPA